MSMFKNFGKFPGSQKQLFHYLYEKHYLLPYKVARRITKSSDSSEDIAQEVFERAFDRIETFSDEKHFTRWLIVTAKNLAYDEVKNSFKHLLVETVYEEHKADYCPEHNPESWCLISEEKSAMLQYIDTLNPAYSMVLYERFFRGLTYREIAGKLKVTESLLRSRCSRALGQLKEKMEDKGRRENE